MSTPDETQPPFGTAPQPSPPSPPSPSPAPARPEPVSPAAGEPNLPNLPYPPYPAYPSAPAYPYPYAPQTPPTGQAPYTAGYPYPYAPYPPYLPYPPAPPKKGSGRTIGIIVGVIAGIVIISCIAGAFLVYSVVQQVGNYVGPITTVTEFCVSEQSQDYTGAYRLLSTNAKQRYTSDAFVAYSQNRDTSSGQVMTCGVVSSGSSQITATSATFEVTVGLNDGDHTGTVTLVKEDGHWGLDSADPGLQLF